MNILRMLLRILGVLGALLLTLLTLAVSGVNMVMVTQYWVLIVGGGTALFLFNALMVALLSRLLWKAVGWKGVKAQLAVACVFLAQVPLYLLFNIGFSFAVRNYAEGSLPQLEAYHKEHGRYPGALDEVLKGEGIMPRLMGQWASYSVFNERSSFRISVYRPIASGQYVFGADTKVWEIRK